LARDAAIKAKNQIERVEGLLDREKKREVKHPKKNKPLRRSQPQVLEIDSPP
jgi:hypothetical protein